MPKRNKLCSDQRREKVSFYATADLKEALKTMAATEQISLSLLIASLLQEAIDEQTI